MDAGDAYRVFEAARWPAGAPSTCPHCRVRGRCRLVRPRDGTGRRTRTGAVTERRLWRCTACRRQFSVLTGSVFEGTRVPLPVWLDALELIEDGRLTPVTLTGRCGVAHETAVAMCGLVAAAWSATSGDAGDQPQG